MLFAVTVVVYVKDKETKTKNRKYPCYYCGIELFQLERHMGRAHSDEPEVAEAVASQNKNDLRIIIKYGTFNHNINVLNDKKGLFYVARSSGKDHVVEDYLPCKFCLTFYIKKELYRHCKTCKFATGARDHKFASDGRLLLDGAMIDYNNVPEALHKVLNNMRSDLLTATVKRDPIILQFGVSLLKKLGPKRANDIAQRMRQLARISLRLGKQQKLKRAPGLQDFLSGASFDLLVNAVSAASEAYEDSTGRQLFKNPNLALKVGHSLLKLGKLKLGLAIRSRDSISKTEAEEFISLHESDFTDQIATSAHASVKIMPRRLQDFPDSTDLALLKEYQTKTSEKLCKSLRLQPSQQQWRALAEVTMSRLLVFNARRGSEVADLRLDEYNKRTNAVHTNVRD